MGNPLIDQGVLNRVKGSFVVSNFPTLNVTAEFLGQGGINMRPTGNASNTIGTLTGTVQSPECYLPVSIVLDLLKTQQLAELYKQQLETYAVIGPCTIYPDIQGSVGITPFQIQNASIQNVGDMLLNGTTPIFGITCTGYYVINNNLFNG